MLAYLKKRKILHFTAQDKIEPTRFYRKYAHFETNFSPVSYAMSTIREESRNTDHCKRADRALVDLNVMENIRSYSLIWLHIQPIIAKYNSCKPSNYCYRLPSLDQPALEIWYSLDSHILTHHWYIAEHYHRFQSSLNIIASLRDSYHMGRFYSK